MIVSQLEQPLLHGEHDWDDEHLLQGLSSTIKSWNRDLTAFILECKRPMHPGPHDEPHEVGQLEQAGAHALRVMKQVRWIGVKPAVGTGASSSGGGTWL